MKRTKFRAWFLGTSVVLALALFGAFRNSFGKDAAALPAELAAAKKDGMPANPEELMAGFWVPDSENATPDYASVFERIHKQKALEDAFSAFGKSKSSALTGPKLAAETKALPVLTPVLDSLRKAAAKPHRNFSREWPRWSDSESPAYEDMKGGALALCTEAQARSKKGDWVGALTDLAAAERMGRHVGEEPRFLAALVRTSIERRVELALGKVIRDHMRDPAFLAAAAKMHAAYGPLSDFHRVIAGEMVLVRSIYHDRKSMDAFLQEGLGNGREARMRRFSPAYFLFTSVTMREAFDAKAVHGYRALYESCSSDPAKWETSKAAEKRAVRTVLQDQSLANQIGSTLLPTYEDFFEVQGVTIAYRNLADTELRLLMDWQKTGKLPTELPDYGATSIDPFSHKPLQYRPSANGFKLYSFGPNRTDDGGKPVSATKKGSKDYDLVVSVLSENPAPAVHPK